MPGAASAVSASASGRSCVGYAPPDPQAQLPLGDAMARGILVGFLLAIALVIFVLVQCTRAIF